MIRKVALFALVSLAVAVGAKTDGNIEPQDTRVYIPWADFKGIVDKLSSALRPHHDTTYAPVDFVLESARMKATLVDPGAASCAVQLAVEVLPSRTLHDHGWVSVPVGSASGPLLQRAAIAGKPVALSAGQGTQTLLFSQPGAYVVSLDYYCPVDRHEGISDLTFPSVNAAAVSLDLVVPGSAVEMWVDNVQRDVTTSKAGTHFEGAVQPGESVAVRFSSASESKDEAAAAREMTPKVFASTGLLVSIKENRVTYRYTVDYEIWHQKPRTFSVLMPDTFPIENISGAGMANWEVAKTDRGPVVTVHTSFEPDRSYSFTIEYSQKLESAEALVDIPVPTVLNVSRESGHLAVQAVQTMEVSPSDSTREVTAVAADDLPAWLRAESDVLLRFKYTRRPFMLQLDVKRHKDMPVLVAVADEALFTALLTRDGHWLAKYRYYIRNNQKQYLRIDMPKGWVLWSALIDGSPVMPASSDTSTAVLVPLRKASSTDQQAGFTLELVYWRQAKALGFSGRAALDIPVIDINCQATSGEIWAPEKYRYTSFKGAFDQAASLPSGKLSSVAAGNVQESQQMLRRAMPAQSNTFVVAHKGKALSLPVEIEVPNEGVCYRFTRTLSVSNEKTGLTFHYRKRIPGLADLMTLLMRLLAFAIGFATTRAVLDKWRKAPLRNTLFAGVAALVVVLAVNAATGMTTHALVLLVMLGILCAVIAGLARASRREVAA